MSNELMACLVTGREADAQGMCADHGRTACVVSVQLPPPVYECVIPGFQCTHDHGTPPAP